MAGSSEHGTESFGFIRGEEFVYHLSNYQFLKHNSAPSSQLHCKTDNV